jgi:uncharacterized phage infection (PIP) family protein YhgE
MIARRLWQRTGHSSEAPVEKRLLGSDSAGRSVAKEARAAFALATRVLLAALVMVVVSGCGRYKQDLEEAKHRIDNLTADNKKCHEIVVGLEKDKRQLTEERQAVDEKTKALASELDDLKKANSALADQLKELTKKNSELSTDLSSLKRENSNLSRKVEELKSRATESGGPGQPATAEEGEAIPLTGAGRIMPKPAENMSPCDAVLAFMKASEQVVRMYKGGQRAEMLKKVKQEYGPRMKGAPQAAMKNAEAWVDELSSSWDKPKENTIFNLLSKRNSVLSACKKKPGDAGF